MLTDAELASMRTTADTALPDTLVIENQSWTDDGGGGGTQVWTSGGTVSCRLAPQGGQGANEGEEGDRITPQAQFIFTVPHSTVVTPDSRLVHSAGTFNVEAIRWRSWELTKRIEARRRTG